MNEYRQQKDKLEIEAMRRNPETALPGGQGGFDNKLDELGALDAIEACGMYVDRAMYNMKKSVQNFFRELLELMFQCGRACSGHAKDILPDCPFHSRTDFLCHFVLGRIPGFAEPMVCPLYQHLSVAARL